MPQSASGFHPGRGRPLPLGAWSQVGGVNFALFSRHATSVELLIFDKPMDSTPCFSIKLDPERNRSGDIWHVYVFGAKTSQYYAYHVGGHYCPQDGLRFNLYKLVIDPYAIALSRVREWDFTMARGYDAKSRQEDISFSSEDNARCAAKAIIVNPDFDWDNDRPLYRPWSQTIIYETHVRGLTVHPSASVKNPGTYLGLVEKIPYLKELGITAVELLPIQEFNENELTRVNPLTSEHLQNYWGYNPVAFFAPKQSYASHQDDDSHVREFKEMVRALHQAGIEIILDVVFNHTAEGNRLGPTLCLRGLDNSVYYLLEEDPRFYRDYTGCGNTINCNHPVVRDLILDCLRYWVIEMHVDGFRFDLAAVLGRDESGNIMHNPPLLERIAEDPILRKIKLIAEAWDAGGAYFVGNFPGQRWSEWNARYRDDVRRFWHGAPGMAGALASRLCGSADLYERSGKEPVNSINFVTSHDGFTLNDLVSYTHKHNETNGEDNHDGADENYSANYGSEGETDDPDIESIRLRQIKNMLATLLLSRGVPMLLGGDEFRRTQGGNNNAYCQDNETSWYDWDLLERHRELFRFTRALIALRRQFPVFSEECFYTDSEISWFNADGKLPEWNGPDGILGCHIHPQQAVTQLCLLFNSTTRAVAFKLPAAVPEWRIAIDTARASPEDIYEPDTTSAAVARNTYRVQTRSLVMLYSI